MHTAPMPSGRGMGGISTLVLSTVIGASARASRTPTSRTAFAPGGTGTSVCQRCVLSFSRLPVAGSPSTREVPLADGWPRDPPQAVEYVDLPPAHTRPEHI